MQRHREAWNTKDVEWSAAPRIHEKSEHWDITLGLTAVRHRNEFSGVVGEMNFTAIDQAVRRVVVTYADRTEHVHPSSVWNFEGVTVPKKPIHKLRFDCEVVGRSWSFEWIVERILEPDEVVLEFFDPETGQRATSLAEGRSVALRLLLAPENEKAAALFFSASVDTSSFPQSSLWLLEAAPATGLTRQFVSAPRRIARFDPQAETESTEPTLLVNEGDLVTGRAEGVTTTFAIEAEPAEVLAVRFVAQDAEGVWMEIDQLPAAPASFRVEVEFSTQPTAREKAIHLLVWPEDAEFDPELLSEALASTEEIPSRSLPLLEATGDALRLQTRDLHLAAGEAEPAEDAIAANPADFLLAFIGEVHALAAASAHGAATVALTVDPAERHPHDAEPLDLVATLQPSTEDFSTRGILLFTFASNDDSTVTVEVPLEDFEPNATLTIAWSPEEGQWIGSGGGEEIIELGAGLYQVTATAKLDSPGITVQASAPQKITLHPPPQLIVYEPTRENAGLALGERAEVDHVVHDQKFKIGVIHSPYTSTNQPENAKVTLTSSVEAIEVEVPRLESGGAGIGIYDMRGDTVVTYHTGRPQTWPELVTHPLGETITISYDGVSRPMQVSRDRYTREAREIAEVLRDYQAVFAAMGALNLAPEMQQEVQAKTDLLFRALTLHEFLGTVPTLKLIEISGGYLELIQQPPSAWGQRDTGYMAEDFLPGVPTVPYGWTAEAQMLRNRSRAGEARTLEGYYDVLSSLMTGAAMLPYQVIKALPEILASPVYSGYTLYSGRQMDGEWASGQQKVFAGVEIALVFIPIAAKALKVTRPDLYERALTRLRLADDLPPTRILPDEALSGPRWPEIGAKIKKAEQVIGTHEATIARLRNAIAQFPNDRRAARTRVNDVTTELTKFDQEAPALERMERARTKIRDAETKFRALERPTAAQVDEHRALMSQEMAKIDKEREIFVRHREKIAKRLKTEQQALRTLEEEGAKLKRNLAKTQDHIKTNQGDIEKWRRQTGRPNPPAVVRARNSGNKRQGNQGELIAFETLSRDGFIRYVERKGKMPNRLENWREVNACLQVFQKTPEDLALRAGLDPDELRFLMAADEVPDAAMLARARETFAEWSSRGVPYWPTGSVGPDGIYWNPKTNRLRIVEVKTGGAELGATQLTNGGIEKWIARMKGRKNRMYRPGLAEALTQALRSGDLERCLIRVNGREVIEVKLLTETAGELVEIPIVGGRG